MNLSRRGFLKASLASSAALTLSSRFAFASESLIQAVQFFQGSPTKLGTTVVLNTKTLVQVPLPASPLPITANHAVISLFIKQGLIMGADYPGYQTLIGTGSLLGHESFAVRMLPPHAVISQTKAPVLQIFATANSENPNAAFFNYLIPDLLSTNSDWHQVNINIGSIPTPTPRWLIDAIDIDVNIFKINIPFSGYWADRNNSILNSQFPPLVFNWPMTTTGLKTAGNSLDYYSLYFGQPVRSFASGFAPFEPISSQYFLGFQGSLAKVFANFNPPPGITSASLIAKQAFVKVVENNIIAQVTSAIGANLAQIRNLENTITQLQAVIETNEAADVAALYHQINAGTAQLLANINLARNLATQAGASVATQESLMSAAFNMQAAINEAKIFAQPAMIEGFVNDSTADLAEAQSYNQTLAGGLNGTATPMPPYATNVLAPGTYSTPQIMLDGNAGGTTSLSSTGTAYTDPNSFGNNQGIVSSNTIQTDSSGSIIDTTSSTPISVDTSAQTPFGFTIIEPASSDP